MAHQYQKRAERSTELGNLTICSFCSPSEIMSLSFNETFTKYARYNPIISRKETLSDVASQPDTNVTLAVTDDGKIVGFSILEYPKPDERWIRVGERIMMEVSVIEVSRLWRSAGIAKDLLNFLVDHPLKEERIFYMVGYSWTWDMDGKDIMPMAYRDMMIKLFTPFGFKIFQTNEPNIMLRPENLFMARIGTNISEKIQKQFKLVRFNMDT
ncbi:GNAT family N-acetyltransferase [Desulfonema magnum]|uniref:Acyltransferase domain-containing protein n=1 Tax=Desulfonema magnum TaxID=45655 RepID=A0A975BPY5_9BACT|nr:GNAT family N-acetyltransferase [Desulfonema magnum]QTA89496.1 acyltransferase domain-containing protein [Desulfonema magnum]